MKVSYEQCLKAIKTKSEPSTVIKDLWISRSAIAIQLDDRVQPVFGFATGYDRKKCEISSFYEILEHLVFLPYLYDEKSLNKVVTIYNLELFDNHKEKTAKDFLIGALSTKGMFYGNGCAISTNLESAVLHSKREILERHICCEIWYHRTRPIWQEKCKIETLSSAVNIDIYRTDIAWEGTFAMAALICEETGFFSVGAAIRNNFELAYQHAIGEAVMLFEDAKKGRNGVSTTERSQKNILSLRDKTISTSRKLHFQKLVGGYLTNNKSIQPICHTIVFESFHGLYAARTFSEDCIDPRWFENNTDLPVMPLF